MTYLCDELVPWIDERFGTSQAAASRAVQGKSSGGYGALVLGMLRPDVWGGLGDISGDAGFEHVYLQGFAPTWSLLREHGSVEAFWRWMLEQPRHSPQTMAAVNTIAMAACYSPAPDGEPEIPIDLADGSLRQDVWERWLAWDPVRMLEHHLDSLRGLRAISLECGRSDEFNLYVGTTMLHRRLVEEGIEHRFELFDGDHGGISYRYAPLIAWLAQRLT
jgi:S-formylglutathione hydrolase FrmB